VNDDAPLTPERWAYRLTRVLNEVLGPERFPVDVALVAKEYSLQISPDDPVTMVKGASLPGFDGGLYKAPPGKTGWGIIYNADISSPGRINFTLAHELGHYLLHRQNYPEKIECGAQDMVRWDSEYGQIEHQANVFSANLLMPLDDFRRRIDDRDRPSLDDLGACADRYMVSLIAVALRWIQYTRRRACLVLSREGFVLWARSSKRAFRSGIFIKTTGRPAVPLPSQSLAVLQDTFGGNRGAMKHGPDVWFREECEELVLFSDQYDFTISLLHFSDAVDRMEVDEEPEESVSEKFSRLLAR
jgi:hypothetical protein